MTRFYQITIGVLLICLVLSRLGTCQSEPKVTATEHIEYIGVPYNVQSKTDTVTKDRIVYKPMIINGNVVHDTLYRDGVRIATNPETYCKETLQFAAESSRQIFNSGDSLTAKFTYPQMIFTFDFHPKADTLKTITRTILETEKESPFGVHLGLGMVMGIDGTVRPGVFAGVGIKVY